MHNDKFLQQVADYYLDNAKDLTHTTLVFPNRRSAIFMRKYMQSKLDKLHFMPRMMSITYFAQQFNDNALATPTELVFILYRVYSRILHKHRPEATVPDFDKFYFWGAIILNDFNDVESYMVDADKLYRNLRLIKEMRSYYLSPEQIEVIKYLWGEPSTPLESERFWDHIPDEVTDDQPSQKFLNLWEIMGELHREFIKELDSRPVPLAYTGLQSKRAYLTIKDMSKDDFRGMKYAFIGFNILSTSRALIFKRLKDLGLAEFFWDIASPIISDQTGTKSSAGRFIMPLSRKFPMPGDFDLQPITTHPEIEIIGVPSNFGQAKVASKILQSWSDDWHTGDPEQPVAPDELINTAIVMADEHLLMPMLYSIPPDIKPINVTMGISYSSTPFAALMSAIISMHLRARRLKDNSWHYYYQDLTNVLSHPHISLIFPDESKSILQEIAAKHIYNVSVDETLAQYPQLAFILRQIDDDRDISQVKGYIDGLVNGLRDMLKHKLASDDGTKYYELTILDGYTREIEELCRLIERYGIVMHERTFLQMIEHKLNLTAVNFTGEPLKGLQLMSVMDTRTLDFKNLIMMSMNERIFPKQNYTSSFIPVSLRAGYYMPTPEYEESTYAYQFYRLISRAERVRLLYDSRTSGVTSGEMSRYLSQLLHLNKDYNIKVKAVEFKAKIEDSNIITVHKTPQVLEELNRFKPGGDLNLSASALKSYISCPLKFYLQSVRRLNVNDDAMDYIDAASYGSVIHRVVQDLYTPYKNEIISKATLGMMLSMDIEKMSLKTLDEMYYKSRYANNLNMMPGEGKIISRIIAQYVRMMLKKEQAYKEFKFVGAEVGEHIKLPWRINDKHTVNFTMSIDRIDEITDPTDATKSALRFIDYKTGSDKLSFTNVKDVFDKTENGGIFQLLLYCHAYASIYGYDGVIKPVIYKFQTIPSEGIKDITYSKQPVNDYHIVDEGSGEDNFRETFEQIIDQIFESEDKYPFAQTPDINHCRYCPFAQMCGRYPEAIYNK